MQTLQYGNAPMQAGDLYLPDAQIKGTICLLHGGFWRAPYGREQLNVMANDLVKHGYAVWNLAYRRIGDDGGGCPGTFDDVIAGIRFLTTIKNKNLDSVLDRVVLVGHSAGGQLALWAAHRTMQLKLQTINIVASIALAPISDLIEAQKLTLGRGAIDELFSACLSDKSQRLTQYSPQALLPLNVRQLIIHGEEDDNVPIELSQSYVSKAKSLGDQIELLALPSTGHMEFLAIESDAYRALLTGLQRIFQYA